MLSDAIHQQNTLVLTSIKSLQIQSSSSLMVSPQPY